jgi:hypothetical protein
MLAYAEESVLCVCAIKYPCICLHLCAKIDFLTDAVSGMNLNLARMNLREKEKKIPSHSMTIILEYYHNISERCFFCTRRRIDVGLKFSPATGPS